MRTYPEHVPAWLWVLMGMVLLCQGTWLFIDARKRGAAAWFWGLWGLIQFPLPLVIYWLVVRTRLFKKRRRSS